jgi:23S rRNA pseudouridine1911/1915/1917 synthase
MDKFQVLPNISEAEAAKKFIYTGTDGERLDTFVTHTMAPLSRTRVQALIEQGHILVNHQRAKASLRLARGDHVTLKEAPPEPPPLLAEAAAQSLDILFEDEHILLINKPAGLVVHPAPGHEQGTLVDALLARHLSLPSTPDASDFQRPGIVHRLDKDTSGLLIIAKTSHALLHLAQQFQTHTIIKRYLALVEGHLPVTEGAIEAPIGRHPQHRQRMTITAQRGRQAHTLFWVEHEYSRFTLLRVQIITGRTHQIRVHFAAIGHSVAGDILYGHPQQQQQSPRLFLHATELRFIHPLTNEELTFSAPLPDELQHFLATLQ